MDFLLLTSKAPLQAINGRDEILHERISGISVFEYFSACESLVIPPLLSMIYQARSLMKNGASSTPFCLYL